MVDAIVSFAVNRLGEFIIQEAVFLGGVKNEVLELQSELRWMQSFLKDAEQKQEANERIRIWVSEIRDVAYDAEDVVDTYILRKEIKNGVGTSKGPLFSMKKFISSPNKPNLNDIGKEINALRNRLDGIRRKREAYGITDIGTVQEGTSGAIRKWSHLRRTTSHADEDHVVGLEDEARFLEGKILQEERRRTVISIFGMGGLGKTTLARKLYNNDNIKRRFNFHAWICVSQEWSIRDLLQRIIKSFKDLSKDEMEMLVGMDDEDMERFIRDLLEGKRYLVVIDDVWSTEAWESLRRALPDNNNESKVIITTRIQAVAELSDAKTYAHRLRSLRPDESWKLFCKKAFPECDACPPDLKKLGEEMVAKCDGLPLAIIVLGGLLSRKEPHEWREVRDHLWRELRNGSKHIPLLLALSFKDLPTHLKLCFLYMGLFPEDTVINASRLMLMWIAEGFVSQEEEGLDLEEVAEEYLKELIGRSLIQVVKRNWRSIATCRVHDLMRDLAIARAKELNFLHVYDGNKNPTRLATAFPHRRLAFHSSSKGILLHHSNQQVRTLLLLNSKLVVPVQEFKTMTARFKLLRTLDLEGLRFHSVRKKVELPHTIGELIHLKYLGLVGTKIEILPESIGKLQVLETIEASIYPGISLPREIQKLKQLRHLKGKFYGAPHWLSGDSKDFDLPNLQTLKHVLIANSLESVELDLKPFAKLSNLKFFSVVSHDSKLSIQPLLDCRQLIELRIYAKIRDVPEKMHEFLPNLRYLELKNSELLRDPMPVLEMFPKLMVLELGNIGVKTIAISANGFLELQVLKLTGGLDKLEVEEGAMARLKALSISSTGVVDYKISERLRSLPSVENLNWEWDYYRDLLPPKRGQIKEQIMLGILSRVKWELNVTPS